MTIVVLDPAPKLRAAPEPSKRGGQDDTPKETWDERELTTLYRDHVRYVGAIAQRILGQREDAEDIVQDVFIDAAKGLGAIRDAAAVRGWLATVTVRKARRKLRMRTLRSFFGAAAGEVNDDIVAPGASPEDRAQIGKLYALLGRAPANERIAWTLRHLEGEKMEDVAAQCECSLATAKRWVSRTQTMIEKGMR